MFKVNDSDVKALEADLKIFKKRAYPFATKATLNQAAFKAREYAQENIGDKMVERNSWTRRSVQVEQTKTLNVNQQQAATGSRQPYMEAQEFGGVERKKGTEGVAIPTAYSAGQKGQEPRTKLPRKQNRMDSIILSKRKRRAKTRKQAMVFAVQDAVKSGRRTVYLDLGRTKGIFRVIGGRKGFKRGWPKGAKIEMLHDLSRDAVRIPRNPWLYPAAKKAQQDIPELYAQALRYQAKRQGLFVS